MTKQSIQLSPGFLAVVACPVCHAKFAVDYDKEELVCTNLDCALAFPIVDQIPVLLVEKARQTK